jgi:hypothetical protein
MDGRRRRFEKVEKKYSSLVYFQFNLKLKIILHFKIFFVSLFSV